MSSTSSNNTVAIVTGASRGIGKAITLHLLSKNVSVVGLARNASSLNAVSEEAAKLQYSAKLVPVVGDITDQAVQQHAVDLAAQNGTLIALVNNAGIGGPHAPVAAGAIDEWSKVFAVNVFAPVSLIQKALPQLRQSKGRVINLSSAILRMTINNRGAYGSSKAAITYISKTLALEEPDITAIAIHPGTVETEMSGAFISKLGEGDAEEKAMADQIRSALIGVDLPGRLIGNLALHADHELSGEYVEYDDLKLAKYSE